MKLLSRPYIAPGLQEDGSLERQMEDQNLILEGRTIYETGKRAKPQLRRDITTYTFLELAIADRQVQADTKPTQERQCYIPEEMTSTMRGIAIILKKGLEKCPMELKPIKWDWKGDTSSTQLSSSVMHQQKTVTKTARTPSRTASSRTAEPRDEMKIVMKDLNAKVGNDRNYDRAMGREGYHHKRQWKEATRHMHHLRFCHWRDALPTSRRPRLKGYFANRKDKNQVDNLTINGMWRRSLPRRRSEKRSWCGKSPPSCDP